MLDRVLPASAIHILLAVSILGANRNLTADTAPRLSRYFGTSADFWMNPRSAYELDLACLRHGSGIARLPTRREVVEEKHPRLQHSPSRGD